jgi:hypothetical protein
VIILRAEKIYFNLFYCFMILFWSNNIVILSLIIFCLNCNQHVIDTRHSKIPQHDAGLSTSSLYMQVCHIIRCTCLNSLSLYLHFQKYYCRMRRISDGSSWSTTKTLSRTVHIVMPILIIGGGVIISGLSCSKHKSPLVIRCNINIGLLWEPLLIKIFYNGP